MNLGTPPCSRLCVFVSTRATSLGWSTVATAALPASLSSMMIRTLFIPLAGAAALLTFGAIDSDAGVESPSSLRNNQIANAGRKTLDQSIPAGDVMIRSTADSRAKESMTCAGTVDA